MKFWAFLQEIVNKSPIRPPVKWDLIYRNLSKHKDWVWYNLYAYTLFWYHPIVKAYLLLLVLGLWIILLFLYSLLTAIQKVMCFVFYFNTFPTNKQTQYGYNSRATFFAECKHQFRPPSLIFYYICSQIYSNFSVCEIGEIIFFFNYHG